ncbi:hypothetical protein GV64_19885 [Endozoicomonas elysicola]|uniref:Uncharacterized protein n=1 Tax=Endozoicomonas elysicola TaxID=305900 RepID=A0A081KEV7_9GAMM|nr:hypothetical protein GV64_19885 [Endozoicomonas elysicola]
MQKAPIKSQGLKTRISIRTGSGFSPPLIISVSHTFNIHMIHQLTCHIIQAATNISPLEVINTCFLYNWKLLHLYH